MKSLELECSNCNERIVIHLGEEEHEHYLRTGFLIEGSEAYHELFEGFGWVLQQAPFCSLCKYDHSEVYRDD